MPPGPDFYLGGRTEFKTVDFDGRIRSCFVQEEFRSPTGAGSDDPRHFLRVRVEPDFPGAEGSHPEIVLSERHGGTDLTNLGDDWIYVYVYEIANAQQLRNGRIIEGALLFNTIGEVARMRSLLPRSPEELFERNFQLLQGFVERTGHVDVPEGHREQGELLATWLSNVRRSQLLGELPADWARRLEALPGWRWLPGDDFFLLDRYARREGNTDVPPEHREDGRPLGAWVRLQRHDYRKGVVDPRTRVRLEAIPHWHW
ncbi:MAG TPA: helicase associated domain-containing protein [Acidimicrobiales bacterium]